MNSYNQYIEEFVDHSFSVPREVVRLTKLINEIDEMGNKINKRLNENRKLYLQSKKNKLDSKLEEMRKKIDEDTNCLLSLNDNKQENLRELEFIIQTHIKELDNTYNKYKKDYDTANWGFQQPGNQEISSTPANTGNSGRNTMKDKIHSHQTAQSSTSVYNYDKSSSVINQKGEKKKKNAASSFKDASLNLVEDPNAFDSQYEQSQDHDLYCICQKNTNEDMIGCDNQTCKFQWFHFSCVGLKEQPVGSWYCTDCSLQKERGRKRKKYN